MPPTIGNGKICYLEIPTADIARSVGFYEKVFGWETRKRGDGATAFDDGVGQVSGSWVTGRKPSTSPSRTWIPRALTGGLTISRRATSASTL